MGMFKTTEGVWEAQRERKRERGREHKAVEREKDGKQKRKGSKVEIMFEIETDREKRGIEEIQRQTENCRQRERDRESWEFASAWKFMQLICFPFLFHMNTFIYLFDIASTSVVTLVVNSSPHTHRHCKLFDSLIQIVLLYSILFRSVLLYSVDSSYVLHRFLLFFFN